MSSIQSLPGGGAIRADQETPALVADLQGLKEPPAQDRTRQDRLRREQAQYEQRMRASVPLQQPLATGLEAEAFEEITFQASEREEAEVHDELFDHHVKEAELVRGALPVEKVVAVMRLMEGYAGFQSLRARARQFARDFVTDREGALRRLQPESYRPEVRFAVLRMAEDLLVQAEQQPETAATLQALRQLEAKDADQIGHLIKVYDSSQKVGQDRVAAPDSGLLLYLSSPLSARVLVDAVGTKEGLDALSNQVHRLPAEGYFDQPGAFIGLSVGLARMMSVVRTMDGHVSTLAGALKLPPAENPKLLRGLMDMCRTATPKPKLEKLRSDVLKVAGAEQSLRFDHELMKQVSQYPESVWISVDAKTAVQGWLREAQGLHYRREGVLGITGQLERGAIRTVAEAG